MTGFGCDKPNSLKIAVAFIEEENALACFGKWLIVMCGNAGVYVVMYRLFMLIYCTGNGVVEFDNGKTSVVNMDFWSELLKVYKSYVLSRLTLHWLSTVIFMEADVPHR